MDWTKIFPGLPDSFGKAGAQQPKSERVPVIVVTLELRFKHDSDAVKNPRSAALPDWCRWHGCAFMEWDGRFAEIQIEETVLASKLFILARSFPDIQEVVELQRFTAFKARSRRWDAVYIPLKGADDEMRGGPSP